MGANDVAPASRLRLVAVSVLIGTTIEWYDFMLYGAAAATVFSPLFFPHSSPAAGLLLSFSTFTAGFLARPLGGVIFGHFGDRIGRKRMLVISLSMMGVTTMLMGLIPTYQSIGVGAPTLLVVLRIVQGLGLGGEWGGAVLTAVEHAPPRRRALFGSLPQTGVPIGQTLATLAFLAVSALPNDQFLSWGWRVPFLLSGVLVAVGIYVRLAVDETPSFTRVLRTNSTSPAPALVTLRQHPRVVGLATFLVASVSIYFYVVTTYAVAYSTQARLLTRSEILAAVLAGAVVNAVAMPVMGQLAQRVGRQPMLKWGSLVLGGWVFVVFGAVQSGNAALTVVAFMLHGLAFAVPYAAKSTFLAERFPAEIRFSASSICFQMGVLLGGAIAPIIGTALVKATGSIWTVCGYVAVFALLGAGAAARLGADPAELDPPEPARGAAGAVS